MKMAKELAAVRKQKKKKKNDGHVEHLQRRRMEITNLLQHCGTSISSLQSLSIKESRHEENCQAIPEGDENEEEDEVIDDDTNDNDDDDDSVVKLSSKTLTTVQDDSDSDSNGNIDRHCNYGIDIKGSVKQIEQQRQRRQKNFFHRIKRKIVVEKSIAVAAKSA